jgi:LmbE family N-acetylglucosaminyl deacetylase
MVKAEEPAEPVDWDVLPNGLIMVQYDQTGDGVPDHIALHQITWSGWTAQSVPEIEIQAGSDGQWVFIVEYDQDRYVYLTKPVPLFFGDDPRQDGRWIAVPHIVSSMDNAPEAWKRSAEHP